MNHQMNSFKTICQRKKIIYNNFNVIICYHVKKGLVYVVCNL